MADVNIGENESFESMLRRFGRQVQQDGILAEIRRRASYEKPSVKRKKKEATKRRKSGRSSRSFER
ncbi:MAG: 30S ribosomal protein S21 [Chloroflexi bacterium RBG_13_53_26]|nr:MAG: 30S ribosomal protein S21 [Chloroflexi bacterium RBG_13_53_26]